MAYDLKRGISKDRIIPWDLPLDKSLFRFLSDDLDVVFGRKTAETLKLPLPHRNAHVLTRKTGLSFPEGWNTHHSLDSVFDQLIATDVIVGGGGQIYEQLLPRCDMVIATEVNEDFYCDTFLPELSSTEWTEHTIIKWDKDEFHLSSFEVKIYERKRPI